METLQNPFVIHHQENHQHDLKSMINNNNNTVVSQSQLFHINGLLQTSFNPPTTTSANTVTTTNKHIIVHTADDNNPSASATPSMLFKSLLSHQDFTLKEPASSCTSTSTTSIPKHCKTEANFSHFQLPDPTDFSWMEKIHPNPYQNPLLFEMDNCSFPGFAAMTSTTVNDMSTSLAFNRAGFQVMFDHHPIRESWPLDA